MDDFRIRQDDYVTCRLSKNISHGAVLCKCRPTPFKYDCRRDDLRAKYDDGEGETMTQPAEEPMKPIFNVGNTYKNRSGNSVLLLCRLPSGPCPLVWRNLTHCVDYVWQTTETGRGISRSDDRDVMPPSIFKFEIGKTYKTDSRTYPTARVICTDRRVKSYRIDTANCVVLLQNHIPKRDEHAAYMRPDGTVPCHNMKLLQEEVPCSATKT